MLEDHWMLAVLKDLRRYALRQGLTGLAEQIRITSETAARDLDQADAIPASRRRKQAR